MITQATTLQQIQSVKPYLRSQFHVKELSLFGSLARNEATPSSDIDLLVEFSDEATLFDLVGVKQYLEEKLHQTVDVVPKDSLRVELREQVLKDAVLV